MLEAAVALSVFSLASLLFCALLLPILVVRMPQDYFDRPQRHPPWRSRSTFQKVVSVVRTLVGLALVGAGIVMLVLPGQGLLTILMGVVIAEFPGKFRLEARLVRHPGVRRTLDRIRARFDRPPLRMAPESEPGDAPRPRPRAS